MKWTRGKPAKHEGGDGRRVREYQSDEVEVLIARSAALLDELHDVTQEMAERLHNFIGEADS